MKIRYERLQYVINREAEKISSDKTDKCEYRTGEEMWPLDQNRIIEQAKFTYSSLGKAFEKQVKIIEHQRR